MTELKTQKDIIKEEVDIGSKNCEVFINGNTFIVKEREEAIKWIKQLQKHKDKFTKNDEYHSMIRYSTFSVIHWIKRFFNITEEELK